MLKENPIVIDHFERLNISKEQITYSKLRDSLTYLSISFNDMEYMYIEQSPCSSIINFFANIGGMLGTYLIIYIYLIDIAYLYTFFLIKVFL